MCRTYVFLNNLLTWPYSGRDPALWLILVFNPSSFTSLDLTHQLCELGRVCSLPWVLWLIKPHLTRRKS